MARCTTIQAAKIIGCTSRCGRRLVKRPGRKPFKAEDPSHLDAACRIAATVAHLNVARPEGSPEFPSWTGYHSMDLYEARDRAWLGRILTKITPDQARHPDDENPRVVGRIGPPDDAAGRDLHDPQSCVAPWWAADL